MIESKKILSIIEISNILQTYFLDKPVKKVYLFGSYARIEADQNSDLDILVELDFSKPIGFYFFKMEHDLKIKFNTNIDLITTEEISPYILPYIEKDKILVYERKE